MRRKGRRLLTAVGPEELLKVVEDIYKGKSKLLIVCQNILSHKFPWYMYINFQTI